MLTADGKAILFTSDRPGRIGEFHKKNYFFHGSTWGNIDIYVCNKTDSGWSEAINLGGTINTPYCEYTPFLHPDGKTLYFSSDGHYGFGELDVFKATRLSDTSWTEWSEPINLGKEINGPNKDWGYRIATAGDLAYFSVFNRPEGYGGDDIYSIELPPEVKPLAVTTVSGKVADPDGQPLEVEIKWNDLTLNKPAGEARSDPKTGRYFIALPAGHRYSYYPEKDGYISETKYLDLTDKKQYAEYSLDIILYPVITVGKGEPPPFKLVVFFDVDKWELREDSFLELNHWVDFLKKNPEIHFEIHGHTDSTGTEAHNQWLSDQRAQSVADYLVTKGISKKRLTARGFGESRPVDTNETEEGRQNNRRVEIKFGEMAVK
ncbi:MAG: OmpA family protein [candidate division KSB1 bacterium]|nr:OmpA family protein [candidate division KSB1 bacterium]